MTDQVVTISSSSGHHNQTMQQQQQQHIILFYKYHPLSEQQETTEIYRKALEKLCHALQLKGRILVGCSETEGINGTLAGDYNHVLAFTHALLGDTVNDELLLVDATIMNAVKEFWKESKIFFDSIGTPILKMDSPEDFKWSRCNNSSHDDDDVTLFPDLNIKLVKELIGTGGVLSSIPLEETAKGYLTPQEWHDELKKLSQKTANKNNQDTGDDDDAILIDCRNTKECQVGHFAGGAIDPKTTTFAQFPKWVDEHRPLLENKRVLMYCTGGIR